MSEERIQNITSPQPEEQEIDLIELAQKVWASRKLVFKACGIAAPVSYTHLTLPTNREV